MMEVGIEANESSDNLDVSFYYRDVVNNYRSAMEGKKVEDSIPFIRIRIPADPTLVIDQPARQEYREKYHAEWAAFCGGEGSAAGIPLSEFPSVSSSQAEVLSQLGVKTVEQLARLSDLQCQRIGMGSVGLRYGASKMLSERSSPRNEAEALRRENEDMKERIGRLEALLSVKAEPDAPPGRRPSRAPARKKRNEGEMILVSPSLNSVEYVIDEKNQPLDAV